MDDRPRMVVIFTSFSNGLVATWKFATLSDCRYRSLK
jgi:hypothetical protein